MRAGMRVPTLHGSARQLRGWAQRSTSKEEDPNRWVFFGLLWGAWLVGAGVVTTFIMWRNPVDVPADSPMRRAEPRRRVVDTQARFDFSDRGATGQPPSAAAPPPR